MKPNSVKVQHLREWVGTLPCHGEPLGLRATIFNISVLLANRSVSDIELILDVMSAHIENSADKAVFLDYRLPPPEPNWQLHGMGIWRLAVAVKDDPRLAELRISTWDLIAALALFWAKRAVDALWKDPIGLGAYPRVAGERSQRFASRAQHLLFLAQREKDLDNIPGPEKLAELMKQHRADQGRSGGKARADKYNPFRLKAQQLAKEKVPASGSWRSRRQAILAISKEVVEFSKQTDTPLSETQAHTTIDGWLKNMPNADTLFGGKQSTSTGKDGTSTGRRSIRR